MLTIEDQVEIDQLYARYNHAFDARDGAAWADCFTHDGTLRSGPVRSFTGRETLTALAAAERPKDRHWTNNLTIGEDESGVWGSCYLILLALKSGDQETSLLRTGIYRDALVRTAAGWKFASRTFTPDE